MKKGRIDTWLLSEDWQMGGAGGGTCSPEGRKKLRLRVLSCGRHQGHCDLWLVQMRPCVKLCLWCVCVSEPGDNHLPPLRQGPLTGWQH